MEPVVLTAFLVMFGTVLSLLFLGAIVAIIQDYFNYKNLQERLKRERERQATKEK